MDQYLIAPDKDDEKKLRAYMPSIFISAALPLRSVATKTFTRKYNNIELVLQAADGVPYGKYARLLLSLMTTYAVVQGGDAAGQGKLVIRFRSTKELLDKLKLPTSRGKEVMDQLARFSTCSFVYKGRVIRKNLQKELFADLTDTEDLPERIDAEAINTGIVPFMETMKRVELKDTGGKIWNTVGIDITLSTRFIELAGQHAVPIDYDVYSKITSSLGKDLYSWFIYRNNSITPGDKIYVSRENLIRQFLPECANENTERAYYKQLIDEIKKIKMIYYQDLNVEINADNNGITLYKSKAVITSNDQRYIPVIDKID